MEPKKKTHDEVLAELLEKAKKRHPPSPEKLSKRKKDTEWTAAERKKNAESRAKVKEQKSARRAALQEEVQKAKDDVAAQMERAKELAKPAREKLPADVVEALELVERIGQVTDPAEEAKLRAQLLALRQKSIPQTSP